MSFLATLLSNTQEQREDVLHHVLVKLQHQFCVFIARLASATNKVF